MHVSVQTAHMLRRWYRWLFAPFVDDWHGLSLNRFLAVMFGVASVWPVFQKPSQALTMVDVCFAVIAGSLAFGKDIWLAYIQRGPQGVKDNG